MDYLVIHMTRFQYQGPVQESVMEVRLAPRRDDRQEVSWFNLTTKPAATIFNYVDPQGNEVHHFDIVPPHDELAVLTRSRVRTSPARALPEAMELTAWDTLAKMHAGGQLWEYFEASPRVPVGPAIRAFAEHLGARRTDDPLTCFRRIVSVVHGALEYAPETTTVDTPVETVLETRRGVCQDFAHITVAIARAYGLPCRYVSGYYAPAGDALGHESLASHAWVEAWLPGLEWTALDPTHDLVAGERHISVAVGRDYTDAAPTRGVFRGAAASTLSVSVRIEQGGGLVSTGEMRSPPPLAILARRPAFGVGDQ